MCRRGQLCSRIPPAAGVGPIFCFQGEIRATTWRDHSPLGNNGLSVDRKNILGYIFRQCERLRVSEEELFDNKRYGHRILNSSSDGMGHRPGQRVHHVLCRDLTGGNDMG